MSLILEALRKSEAERRRGQAPDVAMELAPVATPPARATPGWVVPAVAVAVVVALVVAWWSQHDRAPVAPAPVAAEPVVPADETPAQPAVVPQAPAALPATTAPLPVPTRTDAVVPAPATVTPAQPQPPPTVPPPPPPVATPDIGNTALPSLKLSMHMWNESPAARFVILNGQRMAEGDRNGDITVVAIERDGVIVERNGQRARVPLP
jgi:general secretion pathway protein B